MSTFVFVHGGNVSSTTWNKVVQRNEYPKDIRLGGKIWDQVSKHLKSKGHNVFTPTLSDENENSLSDHIEQIIQLILDNGLTKVVLIGHSYAGMIITGVANKIPNAIHQLVYLDAALPEGEVSLFDILRLGGIEPNSIMQGMPKAYTEKLIFDDNRTQGLHKYYIRCTQSDFTSITALAKKHIFSNNLNWHFQEIKTGHLPMATEPDWLSNFLLNLAND